MTCIFNQNASWHRELAATRLVALHESGESNGRLIAFRKSWESDMSETKATNPTDTKAERAQQRRPDQSEASRHSDAADTVNRSIPRAEQASQEALRAGARGIQRSSGVIGEAVRQGANTAADNVEEAGAAASRTMRRSAGAFASGQRDLAEETARRVEEIGHRIGDAVQSGTEDLSLWLNFHADASDSMQDLQHGVETLLNGVIRTNMQATQRLIHLVDPGAVVDMQRQFVRDYLAALMQGAAGIARAVHRAADEGLRPVEEKLQERASAAQRRNGRNGQHHDGRAVGDFMTRNVRVASPEDSVQQAARMMRDEDTGVLPVGDGDRLVGMVTDRDVALRLVAEGRDPAQTKVREVMTPEIL
ncbi:MAG TPA: CBS domain-containing protein, partial [Acetobacteraceae bacterium]|nr:CBS domain-containing protein [Acetobacteraceae bacterium]